jgi:hypothetical protein
MINEIIGLLLLQGYFFETFHLKNANDHIIYYCNLQVAHVA